MRLNNNLVLLTLHDLTTELTYHDQNSINIKVAL